jgi:hypothetical protein
MARKRNGRKKKLRPPREREPAERDWWDLAGLRLMLANRPPLNRQRPDAMSPADVIRLHDFR